MQLCLPHAYYPHYRKCLHFYAPQILRMRLKSTIDFNICLRLNIVLRRLLPVSTHGFLLLFLLLPGDRYNDPGVAVRTAVHPVGNRARKENATTADGFLWRPVIGRTSCPTTRIFRTCPTNRPHHFLHRPSHPCLRSHDGTGS